MLDTPAHPQVKDLAGGDLPVDEKAAHVSLSGNSSTKGAVVAHDDDEPLDGEIPTPEERRTLRHVGEPLPKAAFLVAIVELCERFTYYGASGLFQNYIQKPRDGSQGVGALGMGQQGATGLSTFFQFWCYGWFLRYPHSSVRRC